MNKKAMLDVSKHQVSFAPSIAKANSVEIVFCRCAYGEYEDVCYKEFSNSINRNGLQLGAYGFSTWHYKNKNGGDANAALTLFSKQLELWVKLAKEKGAKWLAIDQEIESGKELGITREQNTELLNYGVDYIKSKGIIPFVYASASWFRDRINTDLLNCDLWVAYYDNNTRDKDFDNFPAFDGGFPNTYWGNYIKDFYDKNRLFAWQFGSTGGGVRYGAASVNIDKNYCYKGAVTMKFTPVENYYLKVTSEKNPACQAFASPDINDPAYKNLAIGEYPVVAIGPEQAAGSMAGIWVQLSDSMYCLVLPDRAQLFEREPEPEPEPKPEKDYTEILESINEHCNSISETFKKLDNALKAAAGAFEKGN